MNPQEERSAGVVIFRKENNQLVFLLLHYPSGHWDFVKGRFEEGEKPHQTAVRETKEETGITDLNFVDELVEKIEYNFQFEGQLIHKEVVFFLAETKTKNVIVSHEHLEYVWLDYENAMKTITYQNAKDILEKANILLSKT